MKLVSFGHVIWAYDSIVWKWHDEGLSASAIRTRLREECSLHVGLNAVQSVLSVSRPYH